MGYRSELDKYIYRRDIYRPHHINSSMVYDLDQAMEYGIENFIILKDYAKQMYNISVGTKVYYENEVRIVNDIRLLMCEVFVSFENTKLGERIYKPINELVTINKLRNDLINDILK